MTPSRTPGLIIAALLLVATAATLAAQQLQWAAVPSEQAWKQAAQQVQKQAQPNDAFLIEPSWETRPRVHLPELTYIPADNVTWFDLQPFARTWILSETHRVPDAIARLPHPWKAGQRLSGDTITVIEAIRGEDPTRWDLFSQLEQAQVTRVYSNRTETCRQFSPTPQPTWHCKKRDPFLYVGERWQLVTNAPHRCLWAMPIDQGGELRIAWDDVPLHGHLVGRFGQTFDAIRSSRGTPIRFAIKIDDDTAWTHTLGLHEEGFQPFAVPLPGRTTGKVTFSIQADNQLDRMFCFVARVHHDAR